MNADPKKSVKNYGVIPRRYATSNKKGMTLRRERLKATTKMFQEPKGRQFSANAVRCAQYRNRLEKKLATCPFTALEYLQASYSCVDTIQMIARNKFACLYRSPAQLQLYNAYRKRHKYTKVSCDATGGVVHKLHRPGGKKSGPIYLYALVISDGYQAPINSMLSEMHDTNLISYWLSEWIRLGAAIPNEYVSDMSLALLGAGVRAFTKVSTLSLYIDYLYQMHSSGCDLNPGCFIRIDIAHFMKNVAKSKSLSSAPRKVRDFFIRCVALLVKMKTLEEAKYYIHAILVIAMSKTEGMSENGDEVLCEKFKKQLVQRIMGIDVNVNSQLTNESDEKNDENEYEVEYENHRQKEHDEYIDSFVSDNSSFYDAINNIKEQALIDAETNDTGDRDNLMYNVAFAKYFAELCKTLLIWSAVNCQFFELSDETASSANCESYFKDNKLSHKNIIPCRVDTFVTEDIKMIDGCVIEASQKYIKYIGERNVIRDDEFSVQDSSLSQSLSQENVKSDAEQESILLESSDLQKMLYNLYHPQSKENDQSGIVIPAGSFNEYTSVDIQLSGCITCNNKDFPTGAHSCYKCGKNVHILSGCSKSLQDEEGYGEKRICTSCSIDSSSVRPHKRPFIRDDFTSELANEMNNKEKWKKKKRTKQSSYLKSAPNWDLVISIDKKVKLGILSNGNLSKTTYNVNGKPVALRNTCAFDAAAQVLAAAYAYYEPYRSVAEKSKDKIYNIAISLARKGFMIILSPVVIQIRFCFYNSENLKKANGMRANLMFDLYENENCTMVVTDIISKALKNTPSYTEYQKCSRKNCPYSREEGFASLGVCTDILNNDFKNLRSSIIENFPEVGMEDFPEPKCKNCNFRIHTNRTFGDHLFIEVPVTSYDKEHSNYFEVINEVNLETLPSTLDFETKRYVLFALILHHPPLIAGDSGHYVSAVKINNSWQIYDDLKIKPYNINNDDDVVIHFLFYIAIESKM